MVVLPDLYIGIMWIFWLGLLGGFIILVFSADRFVIGTAAIARYLGISPLVIGLTIVGFGTSAPEMLVSAVAALNGNPGLAIGNAIGSNIANIGLILGSTAVLIPITVHSQTLRREMPILLMTTIACFGLCWFSGLERIDGIIMLSALGLFLYWLVQTAMQNSKTDPLETEIDQEIPKDLSIRKAIFWTLIGLTGLLLSSKLLVWAAVSLAKSFGVSDLVIGLTIVALGTSLPELAASISSVLKKQDDIALGNVLGSNIYNLLAVLALPGIISPGPLETVVLTRDFPWMIGFTAVLFFVGFSIRSHGRINRIEGALLVAGYLSYQYLVYHDSLSQTLSS